ITPLIGEVLGGHIPTADDLDPDTEHIVDGTLLPCWSWKDQPGLYSGKHKTTGVNLQVVCDLAGRLAWISDPVEGSRHDVYCLDASGALDTLDPANWIGDKGHQGRGMRTPIKKPAHRRLHPSEKTYNTSINKIRYAIERTIANLKTWRIAHTDYRRPYTTFSQTITAVIGLHFWATS
ncbi:MAG: transposase family protein, partial [Aeromicrobium sp.]|uniref:transposase family protein n=1 Tax=Aeromicrobium sp. TaxID=1871063 RepID=UPI0039E35087